MTTYRDEHGRFRKRTAEDAEPLVTMRDDGSQLFVFGQTSKLTLGDVFTISGVPKEPWWRRILIWLRIIKPKPLRKFVVTGPSTTITLPPVPAAQWQQVEDFLRGDRGQ